MSQTVGLPEGIIYKKAIHIFIIYKSPINHLYILYHIYLLIGSINKSSAPSAQKKATIIIAHPRCIDHAGRGIDGSFSHLNARSDDRWKSVKIRWNNQDKMLMHIMCTYDVYIYIYTYNMNRCIQDNFSFCNVKCHDPTVTFDCSYL